MNKSLSIIIGLLALIAVGLFVRTNNSQKPLGNAAVATYAYSTSTDIGWNTTNNPSKFRLLRTGYGTLGNVVITGATSAAELRFYDATTTTSHANHATTSIGVINLSTPANTYILNTTYTRGLIVEFPTALGAASSTITFD